MRVNMTAQTPALVLFEIYDRHDKVVKTIYGPTNQRLNKPKAVNIKTPGGYHVINEEKRTIKAIEEKWFNCKLSDKEEKEKIIKNLRNETNWKLRVLNEQERMEEEKLEKLEVAEALLKLSRSKETAIKRTRTKRERATLQPTRRSSRISRNEMEKMRERCMGCSENQPNQLAHVGPGGCLGEEY